MCYRIQIHTGIEEIAKRFNARFADVESVNLGEEINGFSHLSTPIITNQNPDIIVSDFTWGMIPSWCKDDSIKKNTLNAKIETLEEKPAFRDSIDNRCLVIATGYYDWRWLDEKGKNKQKFEIHSAENEIFTFAGIYSLWKNPADGLVQKTYSIVTTQANEKMTYIHNIKKRMPVMLKKEDEPHWLNHKIPFSEFAYPKYDSALIAFAI